VSDNAFAKERRKQLYGQYAIGRPLDGEIALSGYPIVHAGTPVGGWYI